MNEETISKNQYNTMIFVTFYANTLFFIMSIEETLQNLIYNSKRIAAVTFADDDSPIVASVLSKKSKLIREADPLESAVHAVCFGDESIEYMYMTAC